MGHIVSIDEQEFVRIELLRTKGVVTVPYIERRTEQKHAPDGVDDDQVVAAQKSGLRLPMEPSMTGIRRDGSLDLLSIYLLGMDMLLRCIALRD